MISRFFIDRPVFASVLSIIIVLGGALCMAILPIAQFPEIAPPMVLVSASYPGANAEAVAQSLAVPIEQELSGATNMLYYTSQCSNDGNLSLAVTFEIGTNLDIAAVEVQNRVKRAEPRLPEETIRNGITVTKASNSILVVTALESSDPQYDELYLSNFATINVLDALKRVPGAGDVQVYGARNYSMRIWLNPKLLEQKAISVTDIASAIREQNGQYAAGRIGQPPNPVAPEFTVPVITKGRLQEPGEFEDIILRAYPDGSLLRLKDVGRAELGSQSYDLFGRLNGKPTTLIIFYLQPGANALQTVKRVHATLEELSASFPKGIAYSIPYDTTKFIEVSIEEVMHTLFEAILLVLAVVFIFLQSWRATLVPLLAVPVSLVGAFAGMAALGFTINTLTLFGLVLAIGIVVDDAIVVVENVERIMREEGLAVREATIKAMEEVTGPVIAIVLVLSAVFIPVAFLGGLTGQLYKQFAVTIAISVAISGLVALTLSPALCRLLLRPSHGPKFVFFRWFNSAFDRFTRGYTHGVRIVIRMSILSLLVFAALLFATWRLFDKVPSGFIPAEDQGTFLTAIQLPDGASLERMDALTKHTEQYLMAQPEIADVITLGGMNVLSGGNSTNASALYVVLKPWAARMKPGMHVNDITARLNAHFASKQEGVVLAFNMPPIPGLGLRAGFEMQLQSRGSADVRQLAQVSNDFLAKLNQRGEVMGVTGNLSVSMPQLYLDLDRTKAKALGLPITDIFNTLQAYFGALYVNDFNKFGRIYRVQLQALPEFRSKPEDIRKVSVRSSTGYMVPLAEVVTSKFQAGPDVLNRFNGFPSVQITGAPAPGYSTGQSIALLRQVAKDTLPPGYGYDWSGSTYQEIKAGNQAPMIIGFGLLVVFLILAAQYEKWSLPFAVMMAVPLGAFGALIAVMLRGIDRDIYFQIGLLTLVGLAAKNAILIIEFCEVLHKQGMSAVDAAIEAARMRFRPILMTSLAFILGVVPLAISRGAGAASRHSIGTGVLGGMIAATVLAVFFVPLFFVIIERLTRRTRANAPEKMDG
ncbi:MAG: multidrug efflux RND transporter permease subunit [bacterium]